MIDAVMKQFLGNCNVDPKKNRVSMGIERMKYIIIYPFSSGELGRKLSASRLVCPPAHVLKPFFFSSLSTVLLQVSRGQPRFRLPSGTHVRAIRGCEW